MSSRLETQGGADVEAGEFEESGDREKAPLEHTANYYVLQDRLSSKWYGLIGI